MGELTAHELGHMLGLRHKGTEGKDLMIGSSGQIITKKIAAVSRKYYKKYLKKKLNWSRAHGYDLMSHSGKYILKEITEKAKKYLLVYNDKFWKIHKWI